MTIPPLFPEAVAVTRGEFQPTRPADDYRAAAVEAAKSWAQPGDSETVALARAVVGGSEVVSTLYRAAGVAHLLETLDITELVPSDQPNARLRYLTWAAFLELVRPHRAQDEDYTDTVRRLLNGNVAARAIYLLLLQEPGPKQ
ncbi:MAG: hypothetical protein L6Q99_06245 [Planctomycetes bacterium]|nr:hypothetical protein [Planctomycetota bacterium]